ncbi:MAG: EamA family transporter RarD [Candidatus Zixiibacteriota bacterium]|nr:MAG: EamA family transporter RarD [candidate division Zixibacteria bacterium]
MRRSGFAYGLTAYLWFSASVFWFKAVAHVPVWEVLAHRTIWSAVLLIAILAVTGRLAAARQALRDRSTRLTLAGTTLLMGFSWYVYIWAVTNDHILETSLAYYISPLIKVLLGCVFLRERLSAAQAVSVMLAFTGMVILGVSYGKIPVISLGLAMVSGWYGFLRKKLPVDATTGLAFESLFLTPAALLFVSYLLHQEQLVFAHSDVTTDLLLVAAGLTTGLPLVWYCKALKRLPYSTIGLMMYIMPSLTFLIAVFIFREPIGTARLVTFCFVWTSLLIYSYDLFRHKRVLRGSTRPV